MKEGSVQRVTERFWTWSTYQNLRIILSDDGKKILLYCKMPIWGSLCLFLNSFHIIGWTISVKKVWNFQVLNSRLIKFIQKTSKEIYEFMIQTLGDAVSHIQLWRSGMLTSSMKILRSKRKHDGKPSTTSIPETVDHIHDLILFN